MNECELTTEALDEMYAQLTNPELEWADRQRELKAENLYAGWVVIPRHIRYLRNQMLLLIITLYMGGWIL